MVRGRGSPSPEGRLQEQVTASHRFLRAEGPDVRRETMKELEDALEEIEEDLVNAWAGYTRGEVPHTEIARLNCRKTATELALRHAYCEGSQK